MTKVKSCLLCENYNIHPCECEHCENWDNFSISEGGKALREKIYGDGYQDGHKDGYDKGYDDAQANYERPKGEQIVLVDEDNIQTCKCSICGRMVDIANREFDKYPYCHCGADMRGNKE